MKCGSSGFEQCYNAQIAVDETERIIVATGVTQSASDVDQLTPLLEQTEANTGRAPTRALADAGYRSESNFQTLEERGIEGFVALGRERDRTPKTPDRKLAATGRMFCKMKTRRARDHYRKRKYIGEPPFAWIKAVMGFRRFSVRGLPNVSNECTLACLAANLRRLHGKLEWA